MNKLIYTGPFLEHLENHISLKKAVGYSYEVNAKRLLSFDRFTLEKYPNASVLSKEIVLDWCSKKAHESQANQCSRASIMRQFAMYLESIDENAYVIPKYFYPKTTRYLPHIYTEDELKRFFSETKKCHYISARPYRQHIMPVLFLMLYSCGLRLSEARLLTVGDVDIEEGILSIRHSKKDNDRLVPMTNFLKQRCQEYYAKVHSYSEDSNWFFPGEPGKPLTLGNVYRNFRRFLWKAGISHRGKGKGPRIYDFRHSFACHCLKKWVLEGVDLQTYLPVLKTYMGHYSFKETAYYLRMTADVFPDICIKLEGCYPDIIPVSGGFVNE